MAAYRITITLKGKVVKGIRELELEDVDTAWQIFYAAAVDAYSAPKILDFEVVRISSFSDDYRKWKFTQPLREQPRKACNRKEIKPTRIITMTERARLNKPPNKTD
jgi:hypothetical protein